MLNSLGLGFVFSARDMASGAMARLERRFSRLDERVGAGSERMTAAFRRLGVGVAVMGAGAAAVGSGLALASAAGQFEQRLAGVGAITRATSDEFAALRQSALDAGIRTQFSPDEAVQGLESLVTAGQAAREATQSLIPVLDLAAGSLGQLGVAQSAAAVVGTLNAYQLGAEEAVSVTDRLLRITQLSNFQARDFEAGLSKAAATGAMFNQSMNDTLITMGLLRNRNIDASSAGTAFREATRRIGSMRPAQQALGPGVDIFDQDTGRMRSIIDIIQDFGRASANMSEEERNRRLNMAFGARGLLAYQAVMSASFTTMRDGEQVTLRGAEAIEAMRSEMEGASGTADSFRRRIQDTFTGQATRLVGVLQTLAVVAGEPFAQVFTPVVAALVEVFTRLISAIQAVPGPIRQALAVVMSAAGGFLTLVGGAIATEAVIALIVTSIKPLLIALGGLIAILLPAIAAVALFGTVVAGFRVAFERNLGGIADFVRGVGQRIQLFFRGLSQLFEQGGFSGAVRDELDRAENQGVRQFLVSLYMLAYRAQRLWEGFTVGFTEAIQEAEPAFVELRKAFSDLWSQLSSVLGQATDAASSLPSSEYVSWGARIGRAVASVVRWFAEFAAAGARIAAGVIPGIRSFAAVVRPAFAVVGESVRGLIAAFARLFGSSGAAASSSSNSAQTWRDVGQTIGQLAATFVSFSAFAIAGVVRGLERLVQAFVWVKETAATLGRWIGATGRAIRDLFTVTIPNAATTALARVVRVLEQMRAAAAPVLRLFGIELGSQPLADLVGLGAGGPASSQQASVSNGAAAPAPPRTSGAMPAVAAVVRRGADMLGLSSQIAALAEATRRTPSAPIQVQVQVDGQTLAEATHNASRDVAARSFSPVPSF